MKNKEAIMSYAVAQADIKLSAYPVDMAAFLALPQYIFDEYGVPCLERDPHLEYRPTTITHYALAHWNEYITTQDETHCLIFLAQARWLMQHAVQLGEGVSGWPNMFAHRQVQSDSCWLSATTQGTALSVLLRVFQLTQVKEYMQLAEQVLGTFALDILDGGIGVPVGETGIYFAEVGAYPATHGLLGCLFALLSLFEYKNSTQTAHANVLIQHGMNALHLYLDAYDTGYWTYTDLLQRNLASPTELALQVQLLRILAHFAKSTVCNLFAARWQAYSEQSQTRYQFMNRWKRISRKLMKRVRAVLSPSQTQRSRVTRVCIALTAFPVTGGIRAVMGGIARATEGVWEREYLTHSIGPNPQRLPIYTFGTKQMAAWQFPNVWFYVAAGCGKTLALLHRGSTYDVLLPQDGAYTALFAALAGKLVGVRVVCIDHGSLTLLNSATYRAERVQGMIQEHTSNVGLLVARLRYWLYFPSVSLCASLAVRLVDHFLIPGVAGDSVEDSCTRLGIHPSRVTRFGSMIDSERHVVLDSVARENFRLQKGIPPNAILVAMVCRLAPEKGIDIALEAIDLAYRALPPPLRTALRVVIAGDGPLRATLQEDISRRGLDTTCLLWGEIQPSDVLALLGVSDIFLYASRRGACMSMAVLEAMASRCAVIASTEPLSNASLLANGRGIALHTTEPQAMAAALVRLTSNRGLCTQMGQAAREYIMTHHDVTTFKRTLLRATRWAALDDVIAQNDGIVDGTNSYEVIS